MAKRKDGEALTKYEPNSYRGGGRPAKRARRTGRDVLAGVSQRFLEDLESDWELHGALTLEKVRTEDPSTYLRVIATIAPKHVEVGMADSLVDFLQSLNKGNDVIDVTPVRAEDSGMEEGSESVLDRSAAD
jgi:hypothetical protein